MKRFRFSFYLVIGSILIILFCLGSSYSMENNLRNFEDIDVVGTWISFVSKGEWGPAIEVYDFYSEGRYRIVVAIIPDNSNDSTVPTGFEIVGTYSIRGGDMLLRDKDGMEKHLKFERQEDMLFFAINENEIQILKKADKWGGENPR